jgi:nitrite reductase/ring-hydroxylating ferredoxin subunit
VGVVHAVANASAVGLYAWSWRARRRERHGAGVALGLLGATAATVGGLLGNHLLSRRGIGVDANANLEGPDTWTPILPAGAVSTEPTAVVVDGVPLVVLSRRSSVVAIAGTCPHRGGPLAEGSFGNDAVTCPWHGSCFSLVDGTLRRGPATMPLPRYETRVVDDTIEVRAFLR